MPRSAYQIGTNLAQSFIVVLDPHPQGEGPPINISLKLYVLYPKINHRQSNA